MSGVAPRPPHRQSTLEADGVPAEPPPAYSARPDETTVDVGPRYPFGFTDHEPPPQAIPPQHTSSSQTSFSAPPQHPSHAQYQSNPSTYSSYSRPPLNYPPNNPNASYRPPSSPPRQTPHHTGGSSGSRDGREEPTSTPVPGRVLMHHGKVLVYPRDYVCPKCNNAGYKSFDASHPCQKCWDKYGKPWNVVRLSPDGTNLSQRPLPSSGASPSSSSSRPAQTAPPPSQAYSPPSQPPQQQWSPPSQQQPHYPQPQAWSPPPQQPFYPSAPYAPRPPQFVNRPPPNALVVQPGDPRIGGQLCLNCNGRGFITSGMGFLGMGFEDTCYRCRGTGRVF